MGSTRIYARQFVSDYHFYVLRIVELKYQKCKLGIMYELIRAERAIKYSTFVHVQTRFLPVANLHTLVVSFAVNKAVKYVVGKVLQPKREEVELLNGISFEECSE